MSITLKLSIGTIKVEEVGTEYLARGISKRGQRCSSRNADPVKARGEVIAELTRLDDEYLAGTQFSDSVDFPEIG